MAIHGGTKFLVQKDGIPQKHFNFLDEFSPDLLEDIEMSILKIIRNCVTESFKRDPYPELNYNKQDQVDDVANDLIEHVLIYEGIDDDLDELAELIQELDDTRKRALQTSYS